MKSGETFGPFDTSCATGLTLLATGHCTGQAIRGGIAVSYRELAGARFAGLTLGYSIDLAIPRSR